MDRVCGIVFRRCWYFASTYCSYTNSSGRSILDGRLTWLMGPIVDAEVMARAFFPTSGDRQRNQPNENEPLTIFHTSTTDRQPTADQLIAG